MVVWQKIPHDLHLLRGVWQVADGGEKLREIVMQPVILRVFGYRFLENLASVFGGLRTQVSFVIIRLALQLLHTGCMVELVCEGGVGHSLADFLQDCLAVPNGQT